MNDDQRLEKITEFVVRALLLHAFDDVSYYAKLAARIGVLIDLEIQENVRHESLINTSSFWGEKVN